MNSSIITEEDFRPILELKSKGMWQLAFEKAKELYEKHPENISLLLALAEITNELGDFLTSARYSDQALKIAPKNPSLLIQTAKRWHKVGDVDLAIELANAAIELQEDDRLACSLLAFIYARNNNAELAWEMLDRSSTLEHIQAENLITESRLHIAEDNYDKAFEVLYKLVGIDSIPEANKQSGFFSLARLYDKLGDYDKSWDAVQKAHAITPIEWTPDKYVSEAEDQMKFFTKEMMPNLCHASNPIESAVFIMGNPRSGTSLLEQILSMHPDVSNAGELGISSIIKHKIPQLTNSSLPFPKSMLHLRPDDVDELQNMYLDSANWYSEGKKRVTNKSLSLHAHAGFLNFICPGSRVILLHRHPLDNCLSCHTTNLIANGHSYTSDLKNLGKMWVTRRKLQDHWRDVLELGVMELHYEELVQSQELETKRLLEFLDIPWDDKCLEFHTSKKVATTISFDQVNQKMYTSSDGRWKNYEKYLGPLIDEVQEYL